MIKEYKNTKEEKAQVANLRQVREIKTKINKED